jgi:hypothetical protein
MLPEVARFGIFRRFPFLPPFVLHRGLDFTWTFRTGAGKDFGSGKF